MKRIIRSSLATFVLVSMAIGAPMVGAQSSRALEVRSNNSGSSQGESASSESSKGKSLENKQLVCQKKRASLQPKLDRIAKQGSNQLAVFDKIFENVQEFAKNKEITAVVPDYEAQVARVQTLSDETGVIVKDLAKSPSVDCTSANAKAHLAEYSSAVKQRNSALKEYKTAVKDFLVSVKKSISGNVAADAGEGAESTAENEVTTNED